MDIPTILGVVGIPVSVALTMAATTKGEFRFLRLCLWVSAAFAVGAHLVALWNKPGPISALEVLIAALVGAVAVGGLAYAIDWVKRKELATLSATSESPPVAEAPSGKTTLYLECAFAPMPHTWPEPDGRVYAFPAGANNRPEEWIGGGLSEYFGKVGSPTSFGEFVKANSYKCELINYGDVPIFNVDLVFRFRYLEAVKQGNSQQGGKLIAEGDYPIQIRKVDPGRSNAFVFYLFHLGTQFINVGFPTSATFLTPASQERVTSKIIQQENAIFLTPRHD